jgi:hypothetical protein
MQALSLAFSTPATSIYACPYKKVQTLSLMNFANHRLFCHACHATGKLSEGLLQVVQPLKAPLLLLETGLRTFWLVASSTNQQPKYTSISL